MWTKAIIGHFQRPFLLLEQVTTSPLLLCVRAYVRVKRHYEGKQHIYLVKKPGTFLKSARQRFAGVLQCE